MQRTTQVHGKQPQSGCRIGWPLWFIIPSILFPVGSSVRADENDTREVNRLSAAVRYLSSDQLEGRGVGTVGLDRAAEFIAEQFRSFGLETELFDGSPFQEFEIDANPQQGPDNQLTLIGPATSPDGEPRTITLRIATEFNPLALGNSGKFDAPLVFAGYGITASDQSYDDYADLDVKGKAVLILRKEPQQNDAESVFDGQRNSRHALFSRKVANAFQHGAVAVLLINDHVTVHAARQQQRKQWSEATDELVELRTKFNKLEQPTPEDVEKHRGEVVALARRIEQLGRSLETGSDDVLGFREAGSPSARLPVLFCRRDALTPALNAAFPNQSLNQLERQIDENLTPVSRELAGWSVVGSTDVVQRKESVKNVLGVLEGSGPLANETVIVGAHYDHLGSGGSGSLAPWTSDIHNGADDNASGTAGLLEIAHRFATAPTPPRRRIVFIAFSAEEKGLKGSRFYVSKPRFPLERTVAMINLDMIGRLTDEKLTVYGTGTAAEFNQLVDQLNQKYAFTLTKQASGFGPSDHSSFYEKKIPVFHLFTGKHRDYHRPSDDYEHINLEGMERITRFAGDLVEAVVTAEQKPEYRQTRRRGRRGAAQGATFGAAVTNAPDGRGVRLTEIVQNGPAAKAGLRAGDQVLMLHGKNVRDVSQFRDLLQTRQEEQPARITILRDGEEQTRKITLQVPARRTNRRQPDR